MGDICSRQRKIWTYVRYLDWRISRYEMKIILNFLLHQEGVTMCARLYWLVMRSSDLFVQRVTKLQNP
jgi:hypothetical protein